LEANIQGKANHTLSSSTAIQVAQNNAFCLASQREDSNITLITSYILLVKGGGSIVMHKATINMMHAHPIHPHKIASLRWQSRSMSMA
jgi:hypothetical protein